MKKRDKIIGAIIFSVFAILIFFSNTIYNLNKARVTVSIPKAGNLSKMEISTGIVEWSKKEELYSEIDAIVSELYVEDGAKISKGDKLLSFSFNKEDELLKLKQLQIDYKKLEIDIKNSSLQLRKIENKINESQGQNIVKDEYGSYELENLKNKINIARTTLNNNTQLLELGELSRIDFDSSKSALELLEKEYKNLEDEIAKKIAKAENDYTQKEKQKENEIKNGVIDKSEIAGSINSKKLELENNLLQQQNVKNKISKYEKNSTLYATIDGTIISIGVKKGQFLSANSAILSLGIGNEFKIDVKINEKNNFVTIGDKCAIKNLEKNLQGEVVKVEAVSGEKKVTVKIVSDSITTGETFDVTFKKEGKNTETLVPNAAVNKDSDGYFLYMVKERESVMGKEYYIEKTKVVIGDSDDKNTVIKSGIGFFEPVVILSNKSISEGISVVIKNEGDIIVK